MRTSLEILDKTPLPKAKSTVAALNDRIAELEAALGLCAGPKIWHVPRAAARIAALEKQLESAGVTVGNLAEKPETLSGRAKFVATTRLEGQNPKPLDPNSKLTGRARFNASVKIATK